MTQNEKQQKALQIYAALGELFVRTKKLNQELEQYAKQTEYFENEIIKLANTPVVDEKVSENDTKEQ